MSSAKSEIPLTLKAPSSVKTYLGQLEEWVRGRARWEERGSWEKRGRDGHAMGKCFGETKLRGRKGGHKGLWKRQTVPLTCALKEMLPPMPRKGGKDRGERERMERDRGREGRRDQWKDGLKVRGRQKVRKKSGRTHQCRSAVCGADQFKTLFKGERVCVHACMHTRVWEYLKGKVFSVKLCTWMCVWERR